MGGNRSRRQQAAETRSAETVAQERQQAEGLRTELNKRRDIVGAGLPETLEAARRGAESVAETGGYRPTDIDLTGRGREGYEEFSKTGGFGEGDREAFLRRATSPVAAIYSRSLDELDRRASLQGGYMPGFDTSRAKVTRQAANAAAEASTAGNVALSQQVREGKLAGLGGLERTKVQAGEAAAGIAAGRRSGQDLLQRYSQFGVAALNDIDIMDLRNRLQSGQMSQFDTQLLTQLAAQDRTTFEKIMGGIGAIGGATAGILGAV